MGFPTLNIFINFDNISVDFIDITAGIFGCVFEKFIYGGDILFEKHPEDVQLFYQLCGFTGLFCLFCLFCLFYLYTYSFYLIF